jgi:membrane-associated phospholipid phosphatase
LSHQLPKWIFATMDVSKDELELIAHTHRLDRPPLRYAAAASCVLLALGVAAFWIDLPVSRWCLHHKVPGGFDKLLSLAEVFAHGWGVAAILVTVWVLDPLQRWKMPRLLLASLGTGLIGNVAKAIIWRTRPYRFDFESDVWGTFGAWFPPLLRASHLQSMPSGHTVTAVGLAVGLAWMYPQGKWWFALIAVAAALERVASGAHFTSDVLFGAALGMLVSNALISLPSLGYLGNRCERYLGRPVKPDESVTRHKCRAYDPAAPGKAQ